MDLIIELIKAAVFGFVEGVTEWLPVSSTGHMLLLEEFLQLQVSPAFWKMFLVVIQLGAILAVCVLYFGQLNPFSPHKSSDERRSTLTLWGKIIVSCIPAALVGIPLDDWMDEHLSSPFVVAAALIVYGIIFIVIEHVRENSTPKPAVPGAHVADVSTDDPDAAISRIEDLSWGRALGIGMFQVLSLVPGTSRSGSTIIGGLVLGCSRPVAAEFTFFLAIPVMVGASALRLVKYLLTSLPTASELLILLVGSAVAFVVSLAAIRFLVGFVRKHDFKPFGWYRIALGLAVFAYFGLVY